MTCSYKSQPSLPSPRAQKLILKLQIPRSCLPLAYLDPFGGWDDLPGSNLFSAHIDALEEIVREDRGSSQPTVLIAQSAIDDGLFAIERVQEGIYAMCRLGSWVTETTLERLQIIPVDIARPQERQFRKQPGLGENSWWSTAVVDFRPESRGGSGKDSGLKKTRGVQLCLHMPQQNPAIPAQLTQEVSASIMEAQIGNAFEDTVKEAAQDPEELLKMVRTQYQDALYTSKVRLSSYSNTTFTTDSSLSRRWHISRKDPYLELEPLSMSKIALPTITHI